MGTIVVLGTLQWPWAGDEVARYGCALDPKMPLPEAIPTDRFIEANLDSPMVLTRLWRQARSAPGNRASNPEVFCEPVGAGLFRHQP